MSDAESIVYESRSQNHITLITPVASRILVAVTGLVSAKEPDAPDSEESGPAAEDASPSTSSSSPSSTPPTTRKLKITNSNSFLETPKSLLEELGLVSDQLSSVLREEMGQMRWPDGA